MARVFNPKKSIFIPATGGHPKNAEYRVAWGSEQWNIPVDVTKVQMVYNGTVAGMLAPSYPDETLDEMSVLFALKLLKDNKYGTNSKTIKDVLILREFDDSLETEAFIKNLEDFLEEMTIDIFNSKKNALSVGVRSELKEEFTLKNSIYAYLFRVEIFPTR